MKIFYSFFFHDEFLNLFDGFCVERMIEEHQDATPDNRESIVDNPESDSNRENRITPPESEEFAREECNENSSIHEEIRRIVECIRPNQKGIGDSANA